MSSTRFPASVKNNLKCDEERSTMQSGCAARTVGTRERLLGVPVEGLPPCTFPSSLDNSLQRSGFSGDCCRAVHCAGGRRCNWTALTKTTHGGWWSLWGRAGPLPSASPKILEFP